MAMALAVALVACQGAVGKTGEPGPAGPAGPTPEPPPPKNLAPVARALTLDLVMLVEEGDAKTVNVGANFYDPESEALTLAHSVAPATGVVETALAADGMLTVTPVAAGDAVITVTATDSGGLSASATIAVKVAPEGMMPPMYVPDSLPETISLMPGHQRVIAGADIASSFVEEEDEPLTFSVAVTSGTNVLATMADDNSVTITALAVVGDATVTITATDTDGETAHHAIKVNVRDMLAPTAAATTPDPVALQVGGAAETMDVAMYFVDPNVGALTYAATSSDDTKATASAAGSMVTITPMAEGSATVTVTASNAHGSASQTISVTVAATRPMANGTIPTVNLMAGQTHPIDLDMYFTPGAEGDSLTYTFSVTGTAASAVISGGDTLIITAGMAAGSATITVTATDADGETAMQTVMVTVEEEAVVVPPTPNMAPQMNADNPLESSIRIQIVNGSDTDGTVTAGTPSDDGTNDEFGPASADNVNINLSNHFVDPDGVLVFFKVAKKLGTETLDNTTLDVADNPVIDLHRTASDLTAQTSTGTAPTDARGNPPNFELGVNNVTIEPLNAGRVTVVVTVKDVDGETFDAELMVTVVAPGTNTGPVAGSGTSDEIFPDLDGEINIPKTQPDTAVDTLRRLTTNETRTVIDDALISTLFDDVDFRNTDRNEILRLSVKYFPAATEAGVAITDPLGDETKELASDKVRVSETLSTRTWNGSTNEKLTLSLTAGPKGTDNDGAEPTRGHLVALIATDEYGESFAHVLKVIVNNRPKAQGPQKTPKVLSVDTDTFHDLRVGVSEATTLVLVDNTSATEPDGYFSDDDGLGDLFKVGPPAAECRADLSIALTDEKAPLSALTITRSGTDTITLSAIPDATVTGTMYADIKCSDSFEFSDPVRVRFTTRASTSGSRQ